MNKRNLMKNLITLAIVILTLALSLQTPSNEVIGKWKCYHKELEDGTTKNTDLFSGEEFEYSCEGLIIELKADFTGWESLSDENFKYEFKDSILTLGNRTYIVELISHKELILRDYKPNDISANIFRRKFKRLE